MTVDVSAFDVYKKHELNKASKIVVLVKCWDVVFDVNGNAPSDAAVVHCATEELADQIHSLYAAMKDDDKEPFIVVAGEEHFGLGSYSVEGYNFDTFYCVQESWAEQHQIVMSLAEFACSNDYLQGTVTTALPSGVYLEDNQEDNHKTGQ